MAINARHARRHGGHLEFAAQKKNFFLQGEYEHFHIDRSDPGLSGPDFSGWYVEGTWILTGEGAEKFNAATAAFDAPPVAHHPSSCMTHRGCRGTWEVGARYADMDLNYHAGALGTAQPVADAIRGGEQRVWTVGLNWYLNPVIRLMLDYQHVQIDRLSPNAAAYSTPTGAQIGQSYSVISLRTQAAF